MSSNPPPEPTNDPTLLANLANNEGATPAQREEARQLLQAHIIHLAEIVASQGSRAGRELLEECVPLVLRKLGHFDPAKGTFENWCRTVLRNRLRDLGRSQCREARVRAPDVQVERLPDPAGSWGQRHSQFEMDYQAPFSSSDIGRIGSWPPRDRVIFLCLGLLWHKMPRMLWESTLVACGLPSPFPAGAYQDCDSAQERIEFIAQALGWEPDRVKRRWYRGRPKVQELDFFRGWKDG
jgi:hypothetical protein